MRELDRNTKVRLAVFAFGYMAILITVLLDMDRTFSHASSTLVRKEMDAMAAFQNNTKACLKLIQSCYWQDPDCPELPENVTPGPRPVCTELYERPDSGGYIWRPRSMKDFRHSSRIYYSSEGSGFVATSFAVIMAPGLVVMALAAKKTLTYNAIFSRIWPACMIIFQLIVLMGVAISTHLEEQKDKTTVLELLCDGCKPGDSLPAENGFMVPKKFSLAMHVLFYSLILVGWHLLHMFVANAVEPYLLDRPENSSSCGDSFGSCMSAVSGIPGQLSLCWKSHFADRHQGSGSVNNTPPNETTGLLDSVGETPL